MSAPLTQPEADALLVMPKRRVDETRHSYPVSGKLTIPLTSLDKREHFLLDIHRGQIALLKGTYQNRAKQVIVLARLDFGGPPHRNPDGEEIPCPHLHVYREGWGDKWATALSPDEFADAADPWALYTDFLRFCVVAEPPVMRKDLFS